MPKSFLSQLAVLPIPFALCASVIACSDQEPPAIGHGSMVHLDGGNEPASCVDGTTKNFIVMVGEHNGVVSCNEGIRTCGGGVWGACQDGKEVAVRASARSRSTAERA